MPKGFDGKLVTGSWSLHVTDRAANEGGALIAWSLDVQLVSDPEGNLNHDGNLDDRDIDLLFANLGSSDPSFDLNGDGDADRQDVRRLVEDLMGRWFGDGNLDQKIDIQDVNIVSINFDPLGTKGHKRWARGDFDGDGDVDITDFNQLVRNYAPQGYPAVGDLHNNSNQIFAPAEIDLLYADLGSGKRSPDRNDSRNTDWRQVDELVL